MPNWGIDDENDNTATDASPPTRELVPEGDHEFTIKAVIDTAERVEIRLAHDDRRYGWVFAKLPKTMKRVQARPTTQQLHFSFAEKQDPGASGSDP